MKRLNNTAIVAIAYILLGVALFGFGSAEARNKRFVETVPKAWYVGTFGPGWLEWFCFEADKDQKKRAHKLLVANTRITVEVNCPAEPSPDRKR